MTFHLDACPMPSEPRTREALASTGRAAVRHVRGRQGIRWEYLRERWDLWPSLAQADTRMGTLGDDGWELVTIWQPISDGAGVQWAIFKRPAYGSEGET